MSGDVGFVSSEPSLEDMDIRLTDIERRFVVLEETVSTIGDVTSSALGDLEYPEPIAYSLARERSAALYHEKFFSVLDAGEACVRYTAAVTLSLARYTDDFSHLIDPLKGQAIALGTWAVAVRNSIASIMKKQPNVAIAIQQSLLESLLRANGKATSAGRFVLSELIEVRNVERGHTSARPEGVYEELYQRHASTLHDSLAAFKFLRFPMVRIEDVDVVGKHLRYGIRVLMGPSPIGRIEHIVSPVRVPKGETCVWDGNETLISLGEVVSFRLCDECGLEHTFFLDQATPEKTKYYSYMGSHRIEAPPIGWF